MAEIKAIDTQVRVAQPALDFDRPQADVITPVLKGISQITQVFAKRQESPESILSRHVDDYNTALTELEAGGQWSNMAIARMNRQAKSNLIKDLARAQVDPTKIKSTLGSLATVFESATQYVITRRGDRTITVNRDGRVQYRINDAEQVREDTRLDLIVSLSPEEQQELLQLPYAEQAARLEKRGDVFFRQRDLNTKVAQAEAEAKLFDLSEKEKKPIHLRLFNEIKTTTAAAVLNRRNEILALPISAEQKDVLQQELFSRMGIALLNPDAGIVNTIGFTTQDIMDEILPYKLDIEQIRALGTTTHDKWSNETMALETQNNLEELRAIAGLPINIRNKVAIGKHLSQVLLTYAMQTMFVGEGTAEAEIMDMLISSNTVLRDEVAPKMDAFLDLQREGAASDQNAVLVSLVKAMNILTTEDAQAAIKSPLVIEHVISIFKTIKQSQGWDVLPIEVKQNIQNRYNRMLNVARKTSPKALEVFQNNLDVYIKDLNLGWRAKKPQELPTE